MTVSIQFGNRLVRFAIVAIGVLAIGFFALAVAVPYVNRSRTEHVVSDLEKRGVEVDVYSYWQHVHGISYVPAAFDWNVPVKLYVFDADGWNAVHEHHWKSMQHVWSAMIGDISLVLSGDDVSDLASLPNLEHLDLSAQVSRAEAIDALTASESLRALNLYVTPISENQMSRFMAMPTLEHIDVTLEPGASRAPQASKRFPNVISIKITLMRPTDFPDELFGRLTSLRYLELSGEFDDQTLTSIGKDRPQPLSLTLNGGSFSSRGLSALGDGGVIKELSVVQRNISQKEFLAVCALDGVEDLTVNVPDLSLDAFLQLNNLTQLSHLKLTSAEIMPEWILRLTNRMPLLDVTLRCSECTGERFREIVAAQQNLAHLRIVVSLDSSGSSSGEWTWSRPPGT